MNNSIKKLNTLTGKEKKAVDELVTGMEKLYGDNLSRVILYGSKARKEAWEESDIDIMVVLKDYQNWAEEFDKVFEVTYALNYKYGLLLSIVIKKEGEYSEKKTPLLLNVRREGIRL